MLFPNWQGHLTKRERQVLAEARTGATTAEIAARLFVAPSTVKSHLSSIYLKANAVRRVHVVAVTAPDDIDLAHLELSQRQQEIVRRLIRGESNAEIARCLWVSPETVKDHLHRIYRLLGVRSRVQVVALALESEWAHAA
jgi:DNA-binding CsgD family transcriptional regulator